MSVFDKQEWIGAVDKLKANAARFMQLFDEVARSRPQTDTLAYRRDELLSKGRAAKTTISNATGAIDWAYARLDEFFGDNTDNALSDLGLVWFITVPVLAGITATLTYLITDYVQYLDENAKYEQLLREGYSTREAIDILNRPTGITAAIESGLKSYGPWIAAGLVAYLLIRRGTA